MIAKTQVMLNCFWGKKRWARKRLREVAYQNHKKKVGLYRAKPTRFGGKVKEMARALRLKAELQQIVVTAEFAEQMKKGNRISKQAAPQAEAEDLNDGDAEDELPIGSQVKAIVLDDNGYWAAVVDALRVMTPMLQLVLRMTDGDKPSLGKIYDKMFLVSERIKKLKVPWKDAAAEIHSARWEYLHSPMHSAAYALDPEFRATEGSFDDATQTGLLTVIERIALRDVYAETEDPEVRACLDVDSDEVQERAGNIQEQLARYQDKDGPFSKKSVLNNAKKMAPASWWQTYGSHLKELKSVATRVLAQPGSASSAERNWSVYGQIKNDKRSQLEHGNADCRVFCHEALHLREKLQVAHYKQAVEKWDTDSDSDVSDEEDISKLVQ